jgi:L-asparaginase
MQQINKKIVILGTGGTIAGTAASSADHTGYTAAQIGVAQLLQGVTGLPEALQGCTLAHEQVAQIDSKDMDFATMARLARRCSYFLADADTSAVIITHGTDTLEETAWFLQLVVPAELLATKPIVLTCAMRPATSSEADGPRNVCDAVRVALDSLASGVLCVCAGDVHTAQQVQKVHSHALNAFGSGGAGPIAQVKGSQVLWQPEKALFLMPHRPPDQWNIAGEAINIVVDDLLQIPHWPRVELLQNHAEASGHIVRALLAGAADPTSPLRGIVVAGTGNGTLSTGLQTALLVAQSQGVQVLRASRCAWGGVSATVQDALPCTELSAVKARVQMVLQLAQVRPNALTQACITT